MGMHASIFRQKRHFVGIFLLFFIAAIGICEETLPEDSSEEEIDLKLIDKSNWVDPNDMLHFDISSNRMRPLDRKSESKIPQNDCENAQKLQEELKNCRETLLQGDVIGEKVSKDVEISDRAMTEQELLPVCSNLATETVHLKHVIKKLLRKLGIDLSSGKLLAKDYLLFDAVLKLTKADLVAFAHLANSRAPLSDAEIQDVLDSLETLIKKVDRRRDPLEVEGFLDVFWGLLPTFLSVANLFLLIPAGGLILYHVTHVSKWKLCVTICFLSFWLSVIWTWFHLYKTKQAGVMARMRQDVPPECRTSDFSFSVWFRKTFSFNLADPCLQYHKDMIIDPFWEIPPTEAIAMTLTKFVLTPLEPVGEHLGKFFGALFGNVPAFLWPIVSLSLLVGGFVLAVLLCGYSIRMPFGILEISPGDRHGRTQGAVHAPKSENRPAVCDQIPLERTKKTSETLFAGSSQEANSEPDLRQRKLLKAKRKASGDLERI